MKLRILAGLLLCAVTGCIAPYYTRPGDLPPATVRVPHDQRAAIWQRAITVLLDRFLEAIANDCTVGSR